MESVCAVFVDNRSSHHDCGQLSKSLEGVEQKCDENHTTTGEGASRCFGLIKPYGTNDNSNDNGGDPTDG